MANIRMLQLDFHLSIMTFLTKLTGVRGEATFKFLIYNAATLAILPIVLETRSGP